MMRIRIKPIDSGFLTFLQLFARTIFNSEIEIPNSEIKNGSK